MMYTLHTDGGSRGNPGPAAIGGVLKTAKGVVVAEYSKTIGSTTNNQAEYRSLLRGLEIALEHKVQHLQCYLDSELVVKQLTGLYRSKDPNLRIHLDTIRELSRQFNSIQFVHIPRELNEHADRLVNSALDKIV